MAQIAFPQPHHVPDAMFPQSSAEPMWRDRRRGIIKMATAEGMSQVAQDDKWLCHMCDREIPEGNIQAHVRSTKHVRCKNWYRERQLLEQRVAAGALAPGLEVRDGFPFCTLCNQWATDAHIQSQRHQKAAAWQLPAGAFGNDCRASSDAPSSSTYASTAPVPSTSSSPATPLHDGEPFPIPERWGDPENFQWKAEDNRYMCKLCWKFADDAHVESERHVRREQRPERWREEDTAAHDFNYKGAPPPPPPPGAGRPPPPPQPPTGRMNAASAPSSPDLEMVSSPREVGRVWERFACDESQETFWWWCEFDGNEEYFLEKSPEPWERFTDPFSGQSYWWRDDKNWFWEHSGSTQP